MRPQASTWRQSYTRLKLSGRVSGDVTRTSTNTWVSNLSRRWRYSCNSAWYACTNTFVVKNWVRRAVASLPVLSQPLWATESTYALGFSVLKSVCVTGSSGTECGRIVSSVFQSSGESSTRLKNETPESHATYPMTLRQRRDDNRR